MRAGVLAALVVATLALAVTAAEAQREGKDIYWARQAPGTTITLDGVLDEPAWQYAEEKLIKYAVNSADPGGGWQNEAGHLPIDSTRATVKFLVVGNQLYMAINVPDNSIGGGIDFNRFDGLLMSIKDHSSLGAPKPPAEYFYSWCYPDPCDPDPAAVGKQPHFLGQFGYPTAPATQCDPRTAAQISAWDGATKVHGIANQDSLNHVFAPDSGYTVEMRFDLGVIGYDATKVAGDVIEFNISVYDCDYNWPVNLPKLSSNRTWWQSPWGNAMWYDEVQIWTKPSYTLASGVAPVIAPEAVMHQGASTINVDGKLTEAVWATADSLRITYDDSALRSTYPTILQYRAGQYEAPVNGNNGTANVFDPGDMTVKWFFLGDSLYLGYDVRDQFVQYVALIDRYDGVITSINDRAIRGQDQNLAGRRLGFHVGPGGVGVADDYLEVMRDSLAEFGGTAAAKFALALKPGTTVDTTGTDTDQGYQAEIKIDLTKMGYPHGLGDKILWAGFDLQDGDSFGNQSSLSYGTRTWWGREFENQCCPAYVLMSGGLTGVVDGGDAVRGGLHVLGNSPNPFGVETRIRFALDRPSRLWIDVFDVSGRLVSQQDLGVQRQAVGEVSFAPQGLRSGVYLYRLRAVDPLGGALRAAGSGRMMVLR